MAHPGSVVVAWYTPPMLHELRVENLLLIDRAELALAPGLNVVTGETGAGKTLLAQALDRVNIPAQALGRISELMSPGASLIISDQGLGPETGKGTDFIVLTR